MNYKHSYHAGNHTEVFKHSVLVLLLLHLSQKRTPFAVLDSHAGAALYDLRSEEAGKTGEAEQGIGCVLHRDLHTAGPYLDLVRKFNCDGLHVYPGSPLIVQSFLRENDRLIVCELHEIIVSRLRANFANDPRVAVHRRDAYEAIHALLPPSERRGLVFIDPPFETKDEFQKLSESIITGIRKWPTGIFAAWYPIKHQSSAEPFLQTLIRKKIPKCLSTKFLRFSENGEQLAGSGMVICNTPWQLDRALKRLCPELLEAFGASEGFWSVEWLSREEKG